MTYGSLVLTLVTVKERAAYVTREISVMNKKVGFVLHNKTKQTKISLLNLHEPKRQQMRVISTPESEINIEICQKTCLLRIWFWLFGGFFLVFFIFLIGYLHLKPTR